MRDKKYYKILQLYIDDWKTFNVDAVPAEKKEQFLKREQAIEMYSEGASNKEIEEKTGRKPVQLLQDISKCLTKDESGNVIGYMALLQTHRQILVKPSGESGTKNSFMALLYKYPTLPNFIAGNWFGDKAYTLEKNMSCTSLHIKFLNELIRLGVQDYEYPFNTSNKAYNSLNTYVRNLGKENIKGLAKRQSKDAAQKLLSTGYGTKYSVTVVTPYGCVQIDGHIIDCLYVVEANDKDGFPQMLPASRCWVLTVVDIATRCILGYSMTPEENYDGADVLAALRNAIEPKVKPTFTGLFSNMLTEGYPENGGFPDTVMPELQYALFDSIMLDNAKSHLAKHTVDKIVNTLGCAMNFGSVATPEVRGIIERMFGTIERAGFHRLPTTTGSNSKDVKRHNAEEHAIRSGISYQDIQELMAFYIAVYNNSAHSSLENLTPIQALQKKVKEAGMYPTVIKDNKELISKVHHLTDFIVERTVRGNEKDGRRPMISYENAIYRGPILSSNYKYIGKKVFIEVDPDDVSRVRLYDENGVYIEELHAVGPWGKESHSLKTRKLASKRARENGTQNNPFYAQIPDLEDALRKEGKKSKKARTRAAIIRDEKKKKNVKNKESDNEVRELAKEQSRREEQKIIQFAKTARSKTGTDNLEAIVDQTPDPKRPKINKQPRTMETLVPSEGDKTGAISNGNILDKEKIEDLINKSGNDLTSALDELMRKGYSAEDIMEMVAEIRLREEKRRR